MTDGPALDFLNQAKHFFLRAISEPCDNSLRLVIEEAVVNQGGRMREIPGELPELRKLRETGSPIESVKGCKCFELVWDRYAAYLVTEELAGAGGKWDDEIYAGNLFRIYTKSNFPDHLVRGIGETIDPIQHYKLICLNHLIDVASSKPPRIREISSHASSQGG
jgi:hypothetical protein